VNPETRRRLLRIAGWLLTPVVVWAASFFGGWMGALLAEFRETPSGSIWWMVLGAVGGGLVGVVGWVVVMMRWDRSGGTGASTEGETAGQ
jgi:hypothetical protein